MPGRHRQNEGCVEPKLTRQQAALAGRVLKSLWNPEPSGTPPTDEEKARIHAEINGAFLQAGHTPCYSLRKLGDAISNRMYACRLAQRNKVPDSWAAGARATRRKRNRIPEREKQKQKQKQKEEEEEGMVTPRAPASAAAAVCPCNEEIFGLPVEEDFACTVEIPAVETASNPAVAQPVWEAIPSDSIDEPWNVLSALQDSDMLDLPSAPQSPTDAGQCGTDTTYTVPSTDCCCSAGEPAMDDLDILLEQAQVEINFDSVELLPAESFEVPQSVTVDEGAGPGRGFENEFPENWTGASGDGRASPSEPQRKLQKTDPNHEPWRAPFSSKEKKATQSLTEAQMAAFERFEAPIFQAAASFDPALYESRVALRTLNGQAAPGSAPAA